MPGKIFISYRRDDSAGHAGRVKDRFAAEFGSDLVFMDVDNIELGSNFVDELRNAVGSCQVLLAVIGPDWLTARDKSRKRRLDVPNDLVRVEIATALARRIPVIPVLLNGTPLPRAERLPDDLKELPIRIGIDVRHQSFDADMSRLMASVRKRLNESAPPAASQLGPAKGTSAAARVDAKLPLRAYAIARKWFVYILGGAAAVAVVGAVIASFLTGTLSAAPQWAFEGDTYIGNDIPFKWSYDASALAKGDGNTGPAVRFELSSADDSGFQIAHISEFADGDHRYLGNINATRFWRVRAVDAINQTIALSKWSRTLRITQYNSAYHRIMATRRISLYTSKSDTQGIFKWVDAKGTRGFDIKLADIFRAELSARLGQPIEPLKSTTVVLFKQLLDAPRQGLADMIVAAITKVPQRKRDHEIDFSDTYFCTSYAFIYRAAEADRPIGDMVEGKVVGVLAGTTGSDLAEALRKERQFSIKLFTDNETAIREVSEAKIDYAVTDTPFAESGVSRYSTSRNRLAYKEFREGDFPPAFPRSRWFQEYGVVVHSGEDMLLGVVNAVIARMKADGSLLRLFEETRKEFADAHGLPHANFSKPSSDRPWECRN